MVVWLNMYHPFYGRCNVQDNGLIVTVIIVIIAFITDFDNVEE